MKALVPLLILALAVPGLVPGSAAESAAAANPPMWVRCKASYQLRGLKNGEDKPDDCDYSDNDGPAIDPLSLATGTAAKTVQHRSATIELKFTVVREGAIEGIIKVKLPSKKTFNASTKAILTGTGNPAIYLNAVLGERPHPDKAECTQAQLVTVSCSLAP